MGKIKEHEGKKFWLLMIIWKLDKIKEIVRIEKFGDTKILIDTYDKLPDDIT